MFTGIIEDIGTVSALRREGSNLHISVGSHISNELKIDQSLSHNGVCLTVVGLYEGGHIVTAIDETLSKTNLGDLVTGSKVNLERAMPANGRFDGHIVQGHVDSTGICMMVNEHNGSWVFRFSYISDGDVLIVEKGSICVDGVSLTVVDAINNEFSVAIIPYTYHHTGFHLLQPGGTVNLEFDIIGKYLAKLYKAR